MAPRLLTMLYSPMSLLRYLKGFTWRPTPVPDAQALSTLRTALAHGVNFWNGGSFYGTPNRNSLHLLNSYFTAHPDDADKVVLSLKVGMSSTEYDLRASLNQCLDVLEGKKSIDIFQCARISSGSSLEPTISILAKFVKEGKIGGIGLSEVDASVIRRAHKVHPIAAVEVELSLWTRDILMNGVLSTCGELGIPVIAYSPLGHGFLTVSINKPSDIPQDDMRRHLARFRPGAFEKNIELVREIQSLAAKKNCTAAQLAISWINHFNNRDGYTTVLPIPGATTSERVIENSVIVELTPADIKYLDDVFSRRVIIGGRYV